MSLWNVWIFAISHVHWVLQFDNVQIDYKKLWRNQRSEMRQAKFRAKKKEESAVKSEIELLLEDILEYGSVYPCIYTRLTRVSFLNGIFIVLYDPIGR